MAKLINRKTLAERTSKAADDTPELGDRLRHAQEMAHAHPAPDSPSPATFPTLEGARFQKVPIHLIDPNPYNARHIYRPERVADLAASIGAHGQDVPGIGTPRNGRITLVAGHYRHRAIKTLGQQTMDLMIHENLTDQDLYTYSYRENAEREGQSALDNALSWKDLLKAEVFSSESDLADATGMSLSNINKTMRILTLDAQVLDVVRETPDLFALSVLYELALFGDIAGPVKSLTLARMVKAGEIGRKEIQEARAQLEHPKSRKRKETSRPYSILRDGNKVGSIKVWDSGRLMVDVQIADPEERDRVLSELKIRFSVVG